MVSFPRKPRPNRPPPPGGTQGTGLPVPDEDGVGRAASDAAAARVRRWTASVSEEQTNPSRGTHFRRLIHLAEST